MERTATDYLFTLNLYEEPILISKLLFHLGPSAPAERTAYLQARADLRRLEKMNFVKLSTQKGADYVCLTALGRGLADTLADYMSDEMIKGWQQQVLSLQPSYGQPA